MFDNFSSHDIQSVLQAADAINKSDYKNQINLMGYLLAVEDHYQHRTPKSAEVYKQKAAQVYKQQAAEMYAQSGGDPEWAKLLEQHFLKAEVLIKGGDPTQQINIGYEAGEKEIFIKKVGEVEINGETKIMYNEITAEEYKAAIAAGQNVERINGHGTKNPGITITETDLPNILDKKLLSTDVIKDRSGAFISIVDRKEYCENIVMRFATDKDRGLGLRPLEILDKYKENIISFFAENNSEFNVTRDAIKGIIEMHREDGKNKGRSVAEINNNIINEIKNAMTGSPIEGETVYDRASYRDGEIVTPELIEKRYTWAKDYVMTHREGGESKTQLGIWLQADKHNSIICDMHVDDIKELNEIAGDFGGKKGLQAAMINASLPDGSIDDSLRRNDKEVTAREKRTGPSGP